MFRKLSQQERRAPTIGDYVVHFSAQSTDQLPPEVARAYNIVRSKNRAMLNVSVLRESDSRPVSASVTVKTVNLTGQPEEYYDATDR